MCLMYRRQHWPCKGCSRQLTLIRFLPGVNKICLSGRNQANADGAKTETRCSLCVSVTFNGRLLSLPRCLPHEIDGKSSFAVNRLLNRSKKSVMGRFPSRMVSYRYRFSDGSHMIDEKSFVCYEWTVESIENVGHGSIPITC